MVREFENSDSVAVKELILSILEDEYPFDRTAYSDSDINDISGTYKGARNDFFVCELDNKIVGTAGIKEDTSKTALLRRIFVNKKQRGKGIGKELLNKCVWFCKDHGYKEIVFRATDRMKSAMALMEKNGFKKVESLELGGFHIHMFKLEL
ncbi:MAG: GNAT family N-acetyltransferase [Candidatus Omnitrophica bacterium]|nr:GNAT family N-acetyltransferase [Candidatus Omnitrophota bacterium]